MRKIIFLIISFLLTMNVYSFEGRIDMVKRTCSDTTYITYTIQSNNVCVEEFNSNKVLITSIIINLKDSSVFLVNHRTKEYIKDRNKIDSAENNTVIKGTFKYINGYKCYQYRIKDKTQNTENSYWVTESEEFGFFKILAPILAQYDGIYSFYLDLDIIGMPMLIESKTLTRDDKGSYTVTSIRKYNVSNNKFIVPKSYTKIQQ